MGLFHHKTDAPRPLSQQETGRGGRDGKAATCILYYSYGDAIRTRHLLTESAKETNAPAQQLQCNMDSLNSMVRAFSQW
jgi:bloom syndrome protein